MEGVLINHEKGVLNSRPFDQLTQQNKIETVGEAVGDSYPCEFHLPMIHKQVVLERVGEQGDGEGKDDLLGHAESVQGLSGDVYLRVEEG